MWELWWWKSERGVVVGTVPFLCSVLGQNYLVQTIPVSVQVELTLKQSVS
jgi:hypothetical protein